MLNRDDLCDIILERLCAPQTSLPAKANALFEGPRGGGAGAPPLLAPERKSRLLEELPGRKFLSEYDIKKLLAASPKELRIPRDAIISPLAEDWLTLQRIKVVRG